MEGTKSQIGESGEVCLMAAVQVIMKALETRNGITADELKALKALGTKLSNFNPVIPSMEEKTGGISELEEQLGAILEAVLNWDADPSMKWDSCPEESSEYVELVEEVQNIVSRLECLKLNKEDEDEKSILEMLNKAYDVLQASMGRLEDEFSHLLHKNTQSFEPSISFRSNDEDGISMVSLDEDSFHETPQRSSAVVPQMESIGKSSELFLIDLIRPAVVPDLKSIAKLMFDSKFEQECSQVFILARKDALNECLSILEIEKLSIDDVMKMESNTLNSKIKRWLWATKVFVRVYLASEKRLHEQIFGGLVSNFESLFVDVSKGLVLHLLNFGEAVALSPSKPEKLFGILDMYDLLADLLPDIESLYGLHSCVQGEFQEVLTCLGDSVRATVLNFENAIASNPSMNPFTGGRVHHLTRYVMNFIRNLADYRETLNLLLYDSDHFHRLILILEANLDAKSMLYRDAALQHIFLMNNAWYMADKVKKSEELRAIFGDEWIRKQNGKFQQEAMNYQRATWSSILSLLMDEGNVQTLEMPASDRLRRFYGAFEEVYRTQTAWQVPEGQLRDDLQISTSLKVVHAYRTFIGRNGVRISEKNIRYGSDDLQNYLLDLFEGCGKTLQNSYRR